MDLDCSHRGEILSKCQFPSLSSEVMLAFLGFIGISSAGEFMNYKQTVCAIAWYQKPCRLETYDQCFLRSENILVFGKFAPKI